ncbi:MAG TPA: ABC transporter ATP-binding protein [Longimicrobiales bacterium]|nr:ABC transporter ATP-binding protein [Longimicrobiales bacterium]
MSFTARAVSAGYSMGVDAIADVSIDVADGSFFAVIGPNGSGKSTLLRVLLGGLRASSGEVTLDGKNVSEWSRAEFARRVGVVTQIEEMPFTVSVRELVAMGRYPHLRALELEGVEDRRAIATAMQRCDVVQFGDRALQSLSGGERQRARIARALAQTPGILVLDEPTASLDIGHEMRVFELLRSLAHDEGRTVVVATHQLNLAARYADLLLLLNRGRAVAQGTPREVLKRDVLQQVYEWPVAVGEHTGEGFDRGAPQVAPLSQARGN